MKLGVTAKSKQGPALPQHYFTPLEAGIPPLQSSEKHVAMSIILNYKKQLTEQKVILISV
jgi:hypothetical protein